MIILVPAHSTNTLYTRAAFTRPNGSMENLLWIFLLHAHFVVETPHAVLQEIHIMICPQRVVRGLTVLLLLMCVCLSLCACPRALLCVGTYICTVYMHCRFGKRYGTGPLRRYVDILAQRQIAAVLRGTGYLGKKYLMETVRKRWWWCVGLGGVGGGGGVLVLVFMVVMLVVVLMVTLICLV